MTAPPRTASQDSSDGIRKRVCKACDRCRLKKSKCDGSSPCSRCKADNAICVFGERKKSHDKVYPKGYVEMLEQQQSQLVAGLQETYRRLLAADIWPGEPLSETNGHPLTHDILARLDLLETKQDGSGEVETFEEDPQKLQQRLVAEGATYLPRRGSISSESDHSSNHRRSASKRSSTHGTPVTPHAPLFNDNFNFETSSPSNLTQSPALTQTPLSQQPRMHPIKPSPLHNQTASEVDFLNPTWTNLGFDPAADLMRSQFALQVPTLQDDMALSDYTTNGYGVAMSYDASMMTLNQYSGQAMQPQPTATSSMPDWGMEPMDVDFSKFIQATT